jgi:hypothetical protein
MAKATSGSLVKFGFVLMLALGAAACRGTPPDGQASQASQGSGNGGCDLTGSRISSTKNCVDTGLVAKGSVATGSGTGLAGNGAGANVQQGAYAAGH